MYCPKCSCHAGADGSRFCRSCGFRLDGVVQLLARNGVPEGYVQPAPVAAPIAKSPRKEGVRKGGKLLFAAVATFPIFFGLCFLVNGPGPLAVPASIFFAGLMRMLYARLFEDAAPEPLRVYQPIVQTVVPPHATAPPQPVSFLANSYQPPQAALPQPNVPTTGNLVMPPSVTEQPTYPLKQS